MNAASPEPHIPTSTNPDDYVPPLKCRVLLEQLAGSFCPQELQDLLRADPDSDVHNAVGDWVFRNETRKKELWRIARRYLRRHYEDDAGSVVADAVLDVINIVLKGGVRENLTGLLRQMVTHRAISFSRVRKRRPSMSLPEGIDVPSPSNPDELELGHERLLQALDGLEPRLRKVIDLHYLQELTVEQIAREIDCPVGTVKSRLHRGRLELRVILGREPGPST